MSDIPDHEHVVEAMCQVPSCGHREPISLDAWIRGEQFDHCQMAMRVHVPSQKFAEAAIARALEDEVPVHLIIARLGRAGITDIDPDALKPQPPSAGMKITSAVTQLLEEARGVHARHSIGARRPLEQWLAAANLLYADELRGKDYSVLITAGPTNEGDNGLAITLISHNDLHDAKLVRAVYRLDSPPPGSWVRKRVSALHDVLDP